MLNASSIDIGPRKALVVLRVALSALHHQQGDIGLQDCECIVAGSKSPLWKYGEVCDGQWGIY